MHGKLLWNDLKNNIIPTLNIALFIMLSTAFLATAGQLSAELLISMNQLFEKAQTPHLLQMHTGDLDRERLGRFVKTREEIDKYQVLEFWNVDNSYLSVIRAVSDEIKHHALDRSSPRIPAGVYRRGKTGVVDSGAHRRKRSAVHTGTERSIGYDTSVSLGYNLTRHSKRCDEDSENECFAAD